MATISPLPQPPGFLVCCAFTFTLVLSQMEAISALASLRTVTDQFALLSFKSLVTKDPYNVLSNWNSSISFCDWNGVSCCHGSERVVALKLFDKALEGTISPYVSNLSFLRVLDFRNDNFHGHLPIDFSCLPWLEKLSLWKNHFKGLIPQTLKHCHHLQVLLAPENEFYGSIPESPGRLPKLKVINLFGNRLTGIIPVTFANLSKLDAVDIGQNHIHSKISSGLGSTNRLT
uniref:Leucine-rich repeat-containing N-terminal plant-type domain-containing protein n=3 Tax=Nymphaea colorata TaxID=210225 RepID=A0A5K0Y5L5_9MAGN